MEKRYLIIITITMVLLVMVIGIGFSRYADNTVLEFETITFLPEIYTATLIDDMGITKNSQIIYNVCYVQYRIDGKDLFGNQKYIIIVHYCDLNASQLNMVYYNINDFTFVSQDDVLMNEQGIPTDKRVITLGGAIK
ncbi:MAG: hypothetical protein KAU52_09520 [Methanosarcinales archaeon]|jgi:hypothetical protein|nr:hypothetical protein [Methanosarcinales archaeon]